ncbi:MAG TPA: hypothetical protein EYN66_22150 [Myxococcales bacterium]|nr:hypothetical protein [Myxococcales bacterium]
MSEVLILEWDPALEEHYFADITGDLVIEMDSDISELVAEFELVLDEVSQARDPSSIRWNSDIIQGYWENRLEAGGHPNEAAMIRNALGILWCSLLGKTSCFQDRIIRDAPAGMAFDYSDGYWGEVPVISDELKRLWEREFSQGYSIVE